MPEKKLKNLFRGIVAINVDTLQNEIDQTTKCKRKAMDSRKLTDTFKFSEAVLMLVRASGGIKQVARSSWQRANPKLWSQFQSDLFTWILMMVYHQQEASNESWSQIFYEYMCEGHIISHNILPPKLVTEYHELLATTMDCLPPDLQETAEELCRFFDCHQVDPYSCIIGQQPAKEVLKFSLTISDKALKISLPYDIFSTLETTKSKIDYQKRYEDVLSRLVYWSTVSNDSAIQQLHQTASSIRGVTRLKRGSLVLVRCNEQNNADLQDTETWVYARIAGKAEGTLILVYLTPEESIVSSVEADRVIPVAPEMISKYFLGDDCISLQKCVNTSTDAAYHKIMNFCGMRAKQYIQDLGVNIEVVELAFKNMCTLSNFQDLKVAITAIEKPIPAAIKDEISSHCSELIEKATYETKNSGYKSFKPESEARIAQLQQFNSNLAFDQELKQYKGVCQMALENIEIQKNDILNGTRKNQITTDWLRLIERTVNVFLVKHGFELDAVPEKYLDEPPKSISAVRRNLVLLRRIMTCIHTPNAKDAVFLVEEMIQKLCSTIYVIITEFIREIDCCVRLTLNLAASFIPTSSGQLLQIIEKAELDSTTKNQLKEILKDKQYLQDMQQMEKDREFAKSRKMVTIPVSGLVVSKFCRLQNEHVSVLDLWEPARVVRVTGADSSTPLETAVLKNDVKQIEQVLKGGMDYINEPDANGWTPLHLACSYLMNLPRLEAIEYLVSQPEVDILAVNNYGNTPFHYYAHIPISDELRMKYRDILLKMVKEPKIIWITNHKGESALHRAALAANALSVRFILESGGDANLQNDDGATPLHYAVQSGSIECVAVLLKYFANHTLSNHDGESPLDIAVKLNHSDLVKILSNTEWTKEKLKQANKISANGRQYSSSRGFDRKTIFQEKNVPEQVLNLVNLAGVRKRSTSGNSTVLPLNSSPEASENSSWTKRVAGEGKSSKKSSLPNNDSSHFQAEQTGGFTSVKKTDSPGCSKLLGSQRMAKNDKPEYLYAMWDVIADEDDEITFKKGARVKVISKDDSGWWVGELDDGTIGRFPSNYTSTEEISVQTPSNEQSTPDPKNTKRKLPEIPANVKPHGINPQLRKVKSVKAINVRNEPQKGPEVGTQVRRAPRPQSAKLKGNVIQKQLKPNET